MPAGQGDRQGDQRCDAEDRDCGIGLHRETKFCAGKKCEVLPDCQVIENFRRLPEPEPAEISLISHCKDDQWEKPENILR